jgi:hypothetical protein
MGCDFRGAATAMRWVDADNPAAWLPTLDVAQHDHDTVEIERILFDMAQGKRLKVYAVPVAVLMFDALQAVAASLPRDTGGDAGRLTLVIDVAQARLVPSFAALEEACRDATPGTERREACTRIAHKLQRSDTVAGELAGLAMEKRTVAPDSREAHALAERRRLLEWQVATAARFDAPLLPWVRSHHARWHLDRMRALQREQEVLLAILREQGAPAAPR